MRPESHFGIIESERLMTTMRLERLESTPDFSSC
jgi:hypothetical protein